MITWEIRILRRLNFLTHKILKMSDQLDKLTAEVANNTSVEQSAVALLKNLKTELDAAIASAPTDDGAALQALSDTLGANDADLAAAVLANTPPVVAPTGQTAQQ